MKFLIGFNLVAFVLWYLYCSSIISKYYPKDDDLITILMTTIVFEIGTLILTTGIYLMVNAFWY